MSKISIIGSGRLSGALASALVTTSHRVTIISRVSRVKDFESWSASNAFSSGAIGEGPASSLQPVIEIQNADIVLVCVSDTAIQDVALRFASQFTERQVVAHCSGALGLDVLKCASARGAHLGSIHPLCAVSSQASSLTGAFAAIDGDATARSALEGLARSIGMRPFTLPSDQRPLYHAAAAMASNGLVALVHEAVELFFRCGLEREHALDALLPLVSSALKGLELNRLPKALTGPIARGDAKVVAKHIEALSSEQLPVALSLYKALSEAMIELAIPENASKIKEALGIAEREGVRKSS